MLEPLAAFISTTLMLPASPKEWQAVQVASRHAISTLTVLLASGAPTTVGSTAPFGLVYCAPTAT